MDPIYSFHGGPPLLDRHGGWWIDRDVLANLPSQPVVVGERRPGKLCGAIKAISARTPFLGRGPRLLPGSSAENLSDAHRTVIGPLLMSDLIETHPVAVFNIELSFALRAKSVAVRRAREKRRRQCDSSIARFQEFFRAAGLPGDLQPPRWELPGRRVHSSWRWLMNVISRSTNTGPTRRPGEKKRPCGAWEFDTAGAV